MFKIGDKVVSVTTGQKGIVEAGDRKGSPRPSWAPTCIMVRFDGSGDAMTTPAANLKMA
jgi:hypothetical protein